MFLSFKIDLLEVLELGVGLVQVFEVLGGKDLGFDYLVAEVGGGERLGGGGVDVDVRGLGGDCVGGGFDSGLLELVGD